MTRHFLRTYRVYHGASVAENTVYEADELQKVREREYGWAGSVIWAMIKCAYTAEESDSGSMTYTNVIAALDRITLKLRRLGMYCDNVRALRLIQSHLVNGFSLSHYSAIPNVAHAAGDQTCTIYLPIIFAPGAIGPDDANFNLAGAVPVSEFTEDCDFKVKIGTGALGDDWQIKSDVVNLDMYLRVAYSPKLPEPLKQEIIVRQYSSTFAELAFDERRKTRLHNLFITDDADSAFDATGVTSGSMTIDDKTILSGIDGDALRVDQSIDEGNFSEMGEAWFYSNFVEFLPVIRPGRSFADDHLVDRSGYLENFNGTHSGNYDVSMHIVTRPTADTRQAIMRDMGVPDALTETARAEELDARNGAVSWVGNVPARLINPTESEGQSGAEITVFNE